VIKFFKENDFANYTYFKEFLKMTSAKKLKSKNNSHGAKKLQVTKISSKISVFISLLNKMKFAIAKNRDIISLGILSLIPALSFWGGSNVVELTPNLMLRALISYVFIGLLMYILIYLAIGRDRFKAIIITIAAMLFMFSYIHLFKYYRSIIAWIVSPGILTNNNFFMLLLTVLFVIIVLLIKTKFKYYKIISDYIFIFAISLLAFYSYPIIKQYIETNNSRNVSFGEPIKITKDKKPTSKPDIYYLIFDRYANQKVLKDIYKYDNSPFINYLINNDFYVAKNSSANYPATTLSLSSSLNLDYLPNQLNESSRNGLYTAVLHNAIEHNRVVPFLKSQGYAFVNIGPWWNTTKYSNYADKNFYNPTGIKIFGKTIDFKQQELYMLQDSLFWQLSAKPLKLFNKTIIARTLPSDDKPMRALHKQTALGQFEKLMKINEEKTDKPKFVFSHILMPHEPYVLNEKCEHLKEDAVQPDYSNEYELYVRQLKCTNTKIKETVSRLLNNSPTKPIIIIQADEGPYPIEFRRDKNKFEWSKVPASVLHQKSKILNAYYFPDKDYSNLYSNVTPINTFRIVFNKYLNTQLPLLEDKNYFSESRQKRFFLFDATDKFKD
jgi:hypothetical protein